MACTPPVRTVTAARYQPVWSKGGATNQGISEVFVFTGRNIMAIAPMLKAVRATLTVENRTINAEVEVVFQATNDGITWKVRSCSVRHGSTLTPRIRRLGTPPSGTSSAGSVSAYAFARPLGRQSRWPGSVSSSTSN